MIEEAAEWLYALRAARWLYGRAGAGEYLDDHPLAQAHTSAPDTGILASILDHETAIGSPSRCSSGRWTKIATS
jgi:hypothetical protein